MLLNLSNHPSARWPDDQQSAAARFGPVADLPFPNVPPDADEAALAELVDTYFQQIKAKAPAAVHLMGEMTFTYALVRRLREELDLPVIASTTERLVTERDGEKRVRFRFVRFRAYR